MEGEVPEGGEGLLLDDHGGRIGLIIECLKWEDLNLNSMIKYGTVEITQLS